MTLKTCSRCGTEKTRRGWRGPRKCWTCHLRRLEKWKTNRIKEAVAA